MRKLIYFLLLLPFTVSAQQYTNGAKTGNPFIRNAVTDKYPVTYSALINGGHHSYNTLAGRDSLVSYYPGLLRDGMQVYVRGTGLTYRWNFSISQWETIAYGDVTKAYVDSLVSTKGTVTNVSSANADISVINQTTAPVISLNNVNGITKTYYDPTSSIQTQLNSKAPITGSANYIQNGTSPQTANYNITGIGTASSFAANYLDLTNQTSLTSASIGTMRVGVLNNRFGWMGSASGFQFRREIYTNLAANASFKLPYLASGTLVDSLTNAASVNLKQSKLLQNYAVGSNTIVAAGDSVGGAIGKLQAQITAVPTNYITSNTVQPSLSGNKTTTGRWSYGGTDLSSIFTFTTNFLLADVMLYNKGKFLYDALGAITTTGTNQNIDGVFGMTSNTSRLLITRSASDVSNTGGTSITPSSITISQGATTNSTVFTPNSLSFGTALPSFSLGVSGTTQLKLNSDGSLAITTTPATASNATQVLTRNPTTQAIEKVDLSSFIASDRLRMLNFTTSGNGSNTTISFAHGLSGITTSTPFTISAHSAAAGGLSYATIDATNVNVVYSVAPASATNNLIYTLSIKP